MPRPIEGETYREQLLHAHALAAQLRLGDFDEMLERISIAEVTAPLFNPTLFMEKGDAMLQDKGVLQVLARAKRELDELVEAYHQRGRRTELPPKIDTGTVPESSLSSTDDKSPRERALDGAT